MANSRALSSSGIAKPRMNPCINPYDQLKDFTRGLPITRELMQGFIRGLAIPDDDKARLLAMTPGSYTGLAAELAARWGKA